MAEKGAFRWREGVALLLGVSMGAARRAPPQQHREGGAVALLGLQKDLELLGGHGRELSDRGVRIADQGLRQPTAPADT